MAIPLAALGTAARSIGSKAGGAIWNQRANATRWAWNAAGGNRLRIVDPFVQRGVGRWNESIAQRNAPPAPVKPPEKPKRDPRLKKDPNEKKESDEEATARKHNEVAARASNSLARQEQKTLLERIAANTEETNLLIRERGLGPGGEEKGGSGILGTLLSLGPLLQGGLMAGLLKTLGGSARFVTSSLKSLKGLAASATKSISAAGGKMLSRAVGMAAGALAVAKGAGKGVLGGLKGAGGKLLGKTLGKSLLKKIPIIGALAGLGFGAHRVMKDGDWVGGIGETVSGLVSTLPVIGTAASLGIDGWLAKRDYDRMKAADGGGGGSGSVGKPDFSNVTSSVSTTASTAAVVKKARASAAATVDYLGMIYELMNDSSKGIYVRPGSQALSSGQSGGGYAPGDTTGAGGGIGRTYNRPSYSSANHSDGSSGMFSSAGGDVTRRLLDAIAVGESGGNYDIVYGKSKIKTPKALTDMTLDEVLAWQDQSVAAGSASSAVGRYQFIRDTLRGVKDQMGLSGDTKFDQATQDAMVTHLLNQGGLEKWKSGQMSDAKFNDYVARQFASWKNTAGRGFYDGDGLNRATHGGLAALQSLKGAGETATTGTGGKTIPGSGQYGSKFKSVGKGAHGQDLVRVEVGGESWTVNAEHAAQFDGFLRDLHATGYKLSSSGGYNNRTMRGSSKLSRHAHGDAIDINSATNPFGTTKTDLPEGTRELAAKWGLKWGMDFKSASRKDPMHFEAMRAMSDQEIAAVRGSSRVPELQPDTPKVAPMLAQSDAQAREAKNMTLAPVIVPVQQAPANSSPAQSGGGAWGSGSPVITRNPVSSVAAVNQARMARGMPA